MAQTRAGGRAKPPAAPPATEKTASAVPLHRRLVTPGLEWSRDEYLDGVYWMRQATSILLALLCGLTRCTGGMFITGAVLVNYTFSTFYFKRVLRVELEDATERAAATEGLMPSVALFLLLWIVVYSNVYF